MFRFLQAGLLLLSQLLMPAPSSNLSPHLSHSLPSATSSPMSLSRRAKRSVIVTNPDVAYKDTSEKTIMTVTFQELPLENMVDLTKQKQKRVDIDTAPNNQTWERLRGSSRTRSKILADQDKSDLEESDISNFLLTNQYRRGQNLLSLLQPLCFL